MRSAVLSDRPSPGTHHRTGLTAIAIVLAGVYFVLSLPVLRPTVEEQPEHGVFLALGVLGVAIATRARSTGLRIGLGVVAAYLLMVGSGEAWLIWLHGAAVFGLVALVMLVVARAADPMARFVGVLTLSVVGFLVLAYAGIILLFLFGCGGEGCFY
jgi:hypothetical protein